MQAHITFFGFREFVAIMRLVVQIVQAVDKLMAVLKENEQAVLFVMADPDVGPKDRVEVELFRCDDEIHSVLKATLMPITGASLSDVAHVLEDMAYLHLQARYLIVHEGRDIEQLEMHIKNRR